MWIIRTTNNEPFIGITDFFEAIAEFQKHFPPNDYYCVLNNLKPKELNEIEIVAINKDDNVIAELIHLNGNKNESTIRSVTGKDP